MNTENQGQKNAGKDKEVTIIVNGQKKVVTKDKISFEQVSLLAFGPPPEGQVIVYTVAYTNGHNDKPKGTLVAGQSVNVKEGMIFHVTATNQS